MATTNGDHDLCFEETETTCALATKYTSLWSEIRRYTQAMYFTQNEVGSDMASTAYIEDFVVNERRTPIVDYFFHE